MRDKLTALIEWYKELSENKNGFSVHTCSFGVLNYDSDFTANTPNLNSDLSKFKVNPAKIIQKIDMNKLVGTDIDCEFRWLTVNPIIGKMVDITYYDNTVWFASEPNNFTHKSCRVRENNWHYWGGNDTCPLPEGLIVQLRTRGDGFQSVPDYVPDYTNSKGWKHLKYIKDDNDIIGFKVLGVAEGWEY